jgi:tetratricopeptide (TPR) repeat protein
MNLTKNRVVLFCLAVALCAAGFAGINGIYNLSQLPDHQEKNESKAIQKQTKLAKLKIFLLPSSDNIGDLGMIYHSNASYSEAASCYRLAIKKNKNKIKWNYLLGYLDLENGDNKDALLNFQRVLQTDPENFMAVYYSGETSQRLHDSRAAEKYFSKVLEFDDQVISFGKYRKENSYPLKIYARYNLARITLDDKKLDEAERQLKDIVRDQNNFGPAFRLLGNVYTQKGDSILSRKYTTRAKDYQDYTPPADAVLDELLLISRSDMSLLKGIDQAIRNTNFQWAKKLCDHALNYLPDNKYLLSKAIKVYVSTGNENKGLRLVEKHMKSFNKDFRELMEMADFFMNKGQIKLGLVYFSAAKNAELQNPILPVWLLKWHYNKGAEKLMKEQLAADPQNPKFLSNAINISMANNQRETANSYLNKLKLQSPSNPEVKRYTGYLAYQDKKYTEAISSWKEVLSSDPKDISLISNLNRIFVQQQMWQESSALLQTALENNPNDPMLLEKYAELLVSCPEGKIRNIEQGREFSERAFFSYYFSFDVHLSASKNLATAYAILGDKKLASKYLNISLDLAKDLNPNEMNAWADNLKKKYNIDAVL